MCVVGKGRDLEEKKPVQIDSRLFYPIWVVCLSPQPCKSVMIHRTEKVKIQKSKRPISTNHRYVCCPLAGPADRPFQEPQPQTEHRFRPYFLLSYVPFTTDGYHQNFFIQSSIEPLSPSNTLLLSLPLFPPESGPIDSSSEAVHSTPQHIVPGRPRINT